ncbi:MAG: hypothetical protein JXB34_07890 [Bacteroidales bacterium]|nr:hypothetical protein [Bacteroidales bacterium]
MRKALTLYMFLCFSICVVAQEALFAPISVAASDSLIPGRGGQNITERKLKTGLSANMGYIFSPKGYGGPVFSFMPHISYPISGKIWLEAGIQAGATKLAFPSGNPENTEYKMLPMTTMFMYASGNYMLSDRLVLNGTAYKSVYTIPETSRQAVISNYINNGISVGFNYKIGSNISVGAQFHINSRNNYYPYQNGGVFPSSIYQNP